MTAGEDITKVKSVAIVLAAGSSSRMGQSKQLLKIGTESLLRKTIRTVQDSGIDQLVVVLGAHEHDHRQEIIDLAVHIAVNSEWQKGMGASLKCGVQFVSEQFPSCETILVTVCDQPLLTSSHLKKLSETFQSANRSIVTSFYSGSPGVPVLFHRSMFQKLLNMDDQHGAKKLIKDHIDLTSRIDFPEGSVDLDTPDDLKEFEQSL
jgi:molybdenum cofactor cytidylyltransferase